jgi:hypothetical protein
LLFIIVVKRFAVCDAGEIGATQLSTDTKLAASDALEN